MNKDEEYIELINRYLEGEMSSDERYDFEGRLDSEPALKSEYDLFVSLDTLLIDHTLFKVKNELGEIHKNQQKSNFKNPGKLGIISLAILVTGLTLYWNYRSENTGTQKKDSTSKPTISAQVGKTERPENNANQKSVKLLDTSKENYREYQKFEVEDVKSRTEVEALATDNGEISITMESEKTDSTLLVLSDTSMVYKPIENHKPFQKNIEEETEKTKPCDQTKITFNTRVKDACLPEQNGEIVIEGIEGGMGPYLVIFENKEAHNLKINNLGKGSYHILVSDKQGCEESSEVKVNEEFCQKDFEINPNFGQVIIFPEYSRKGNLSVYDRGGKVMYKSEIEEYSTLEWNGQLNNGETVPGYYVFIIQYEDGRLFQGSITITH